MQPLLRGAVQGARHTGQEITWYDMAGTVVDLTGATITATIEPQPSGTVRAADGTFTLNADPTTGKFTWDYGLTDAGTAGAFWVQFKASYSDSKHDRSLPNVEWLVWKARDVAAP